MKKYIILLFIILCTKIYATGQSNANDSSNILSSCFSTVYVINDYFFDSMINTYIDEVRQDYKFKIFHLRIREIKNMIEFWFKTLCQPYDLFNIDSNNVKIIYHRGYIIYVIFEDININNFNTCFKECKIPNNLLLIEQDERGYTNIMSEDDTCCEHDYLYLYRSGVLIYSDKHSICD